jgi:hypothetical protein
MGVFQNNLLAGAAAAASAGGASFYDHQIEQSARFDSASSSYLSRSVSSTGNRKTWTFSAWIKKTDLGQDDALMGTYNSGNEFSIRFSSADDTRIYEYTSGAFRFNRGTVALQRDVSSWMHLVLRVDMTQSSSADRTRLYHNGTQFTDINEYTASTLNYDTLINYSGYPMIIGYYGDTSQYFGGYMAEVIHCDGQSYAPTQFAESKNGVWIPKDPSGTTFGTNGFHLKFENSGDLGNDSSGNNNDFTVNNMGADHQVLDSPTFGS